MRTMLEPVKGGFIALEVEPLDMPPDASTPQVVFDGVHDDTRGLTAILAEQPFCMDGKVFRWLPHIDNWITFQWLRSIRITDDIPVPNKKTMVSFNDTKIVHRYGWNKIDDYAFPESSQRATKLFAFDYAPPAIWISNPPNVVITPTEMIIGFGEDMQDTYPVNKAP